MPKDDGFDNQDKTYQELIKLLEAQEGRLDHLYTDLSKRLGKILYVHKEKIVESKPLPSFVARRIKNALKRFEKKLYLLIQAGIESSSHLAQRSIERLVRALPLSKERKERFLKNLSDQQELADQRLSKDTSVLQVKLSERVWKLTKQNQAVMGLVLRKGMDQGTSAARLSKGIRSYLKEPNKLFRRVRKEGSLKLSKAARAYHPGKGVYRSSYQNALRLTRTEINRSYRAQENKRWRTMPFVLGFEVKRSKNASAECICDALAGVYPKAFLFSSWHPNCLCQALPILLPRGEFTAKAKKIDKSRYVQQIPPKAQAWIDKNKQKIRAYKNPPLFIKDNFVWDEKRKSYEFNKR